jgi:hypothetical protein
LEAVQVYLTGIVAPSAKAGLVTVIETLGPPGATVAVGVPVGELTAAAGVLLTDEPPQAVAATAPRSSATRAFLRSPSLDKAFRSDCIQQGRAPSRSRELVAKTSGCLSALCVLEQTKDFRLRR